MRVTFGVEERMVPLFPIAIGVLFLSPNFQR